MNRVHKIQSAEKTSKTSVIRPTLNYFPSLQDSRYKFPLKFGLYKVSATWARKGLNTLSPTFPEAYFLIYNLLLTYSLCMVSFSSCKITSLPCSLCHSLKLIKIVCEIQFTASSLSLCSNFYCLPFLDFFSSAVVSFASTVITVFQGVLQNPVSFLA